MFECFIRIAAAGLLSLAFGSAYCFTMEDRWSIRELYSSADGSIQFIVLEYVFGSGANYNFAGQTLFSADRTGTQTRSIAVLTEPPPCVFCDVDGAVVTYLIATHGFADLRVATPNLIVPNGFLSVAAGSVEIELAEGSPAVFYQLPTDGALALWPHGFGFASDSADAQVVGTPEPSPRANIFMPGPNGVVEYFNEALNDYFLTAYPSEIDALDSGMILGWTRTRRAFDAWTLPVSLLAAEPPPPNLLPVCRLYLGDSHFYSISADECAAVAARDGVYVESMAAFYATLPDPVTGRCPSDQNRLWRLWNPAGSQHRYTVDLGVVNEMVTYEGWIPEGYGPDNVAMCVGGNEP